MMALEWKAWRHGWGADAEIVHGLVLSVSHEMCRLPKGEAEFNVKVFGLRLKTRSATMEDGQQRAERVARAWLKEAIDKIGPE